MSQFQPNINYPFESIRNYLLLNKSKSCKAINGHIPLLSSFLILMILKRLKQINYFID